MLLVKMWHFDYKNYILNYKVAFWLAIYLYSVKLTMYLSTTSIFCESSSECTLILLYLFQSSAIIKNARQIYCIFCELISKNVPVKATSIEFICAMINVDNRRKVCTYMDKVIFSGMVMSQDKESLQYHEEIELFAKDIAFRNYPLSLLNVILDTDGITIDGIKYEWDMLPITIHKVGKHSTKYREIVDEDIEITVKIK